MANNGRNKFLLKNTLIFTIGNLGSKFISFFLVPLFTNQLNTSQYGIIDLIATIGTIAVPLLTLNISESVMRFQLDKDAKRDDISQIGIIVFLVGSAVGLVIIPITRFFSDVSDYSGLTYLYVITLASSQLLLCDLRGKELLTYYAVCNIIYTALVAGFNILFLVVLKWGTNGYLFAYILANIIISAVALIAGKSYRNIKNLKVDISLFKSMAKYSIVLIPNSFMWWIMNSSDRIMVIAMVGIAANGIYAISYKLPTLVNTVMQIFNQAWGYSAIREEGADDEAEYYNKVFLHLTSITMLIGIGIICFTKPFLSIYVSSDYYSAWNYVPFLTIGCVFLTLGTFIATSYSVHKDSFGYLLSGVIGAIVNIVLNFLLIPSYKVYGAAIATCVSYIAVFVFRLIHTKKYIVYNIMNIEFWFGAVVLLVSSFTVFFDGVIPQIIILILFTISASFYGKIWFPIIKKVLKRMKTRKTTT